MRPVTRTLGAGVSIALLALALAPLAGAEGVGPDYGPRTSALWAEEKQARHALEQRMRAAYESAVAAGAGESDLLALKHEYHAAKAALAETYRAAHAALDAEHAEAKLAHEAERRAAEERRLAEKKALEEKRLAERRAHEEKRPCAVAVESATPVKCPKPGAPTRPCVRAVDAASVEANGTADRCPKPVPKRPCANATANATRERCHEPPVKVRPCADRAVNVSASRCGEVTPPRRAADPTPHDAVPPVKNAGSSTDAPARMRVDLGDSPIAKLIGKKFLVVEFRDGKLSLAAE